MLVLVHSSPTSLLKDHGRHPNLGVLSCPERTYLNVDGWPWAADNRAYSGWDETAFRRMLEKIRPLHGCLFVVAPDVVADHVQTLERFHQWLPDLDGFPVAFCGQDGGTPTEVPWGSICCLFIGGSSEWKLGEEARDLVVEAKRRGKWVHMGRVNTLQRIVYAKAIGCDSFDGTNFSMYRRTKLPPALKLAASETQLMLGSRLLRHTTQEHSG